MASLRLFYREQQWWGLGALQGARLLFCKSGSRSATEHLGITQTMPTNNQWKKNFHNHEMRFGQLNSKLLLKLETHAWAGWRHLVVLGHSWEGDIKGVEPGKLSRYLGNKCSSTKSRSSRSREEFFPFFLISVSASFYNNVPKQSSPHN